MQDYIFKVVDDFSYAIMSYKGDEEHVTVTNFGNNVTIIGDNLFAGHKEIKQVTLPETVTNIGGFVFDGCENLREIKLPEKLEDMWQYAFVRSGIESIDIPGTVPKIVPFVFKECRNLKTVRLHEGTKKIAAKAFENCINLETVYVPSDIEIDENAFKGCALNLKIIRE